MKDTVSRVAIYELLFAYSHNFWNFKFNTILEFKTIRDFKIRRDTLNTFLELYQVFSSCIFQLFKLQDVSSYLDSWISRLAYNLSNFELKAILCPNSRQNYVNICIPFNGAIFVMH